MFRFLTRNWLNYDILKVFRAEFGGIDSVKKTTLETKVLHHDLLMRLEDSLFSLGFAVDVNSLGAQSSLDATREQFADTAYLRAKGWCALEDFDRIYEITKNFNDLISFVRRSSVEQAAGKDPLRARLKDLDIAGKSNTKEFKDVQAQLREVERLTKKELDWSKLPEELFDGIRCWIDTLARHRLNLRIVPFERYPELQLIANLKRGCFVDDDLDHLLYGYGAQPNIQLSVFGLVTSVPVIDEEARFNIYASDSGSPELDSASGDSEEKSDSERIAGFERAFRALFPAIQGMEKFTSFHHYPRVILHPIAVYRDISTTRETLET